MTDKKSLRKKAADIKKTLDFKEISVKIQDAVYQIVSIYSPKCVMLYMPLSDEVDTRGLCQKLADIGITCCFPVVDGEELVVKTDKNGFKSGKFGVSEPEGDVVPSEKIDICIVPGVMFDVNCHRLGRGGGYYDRFLSGLCCKKIGICPDELLADDLPNEEYDIDVDIVVTEKRMVINGR